MSLVAGLTSHFTLTERVAAGPSALATVGLQQPCYLLHDGKSPVAPPPCPNGKIRAAGLFCFRCLLKKGVRTACFVCLRTYTRGCM